VMGADNYIDEMSWIFPGGRLPTRPEATHRAPHKHTDIEIDVRERPWFVVSRRCSGPWSRHCFTS
jgi:hypothetical protein